MKYKKINDKVIIRLDVGEELVTSLLELCKKLNITLGTISGIGATNKAILGLFDTQKNQYYSQDFVGDHEIAPLIGNITTLNGEPYLHLHVNLCNGNNVSFSGHVQKAIISATFEGVLEVINGKVERKKDPKTGLNLLDL